MLFLFALFFAFGFTYLCRREIKRHAVIFYIAASIVSVIVILIDSRDLPFWINPYIINLFSRGIFATALWCVVMWTGAFPNGSKAIRAFMPVRGEISILAVCLTLGHNIGYGKTYFVWLLTETERMNKNQIMAAVLSLAMLGIMIPLTILSFQSVRKRVSPKKWKRIQRLAYLFYGMIYLHVMVLYIPLAQGGREEYLLGVFVYSVVFIGYGICRIRKWILLRKKGFEKRIWNTAGAGLFTLFVGLVTVLAKPDRIQAEGHLNNNTEIPKISGIYRDGTYTASAYGYDGDIEITILIQDNKIAEITGVSYESDTWYYETAKESLFAQILLEQGKEADVVSGATYSSKAIITAIEKALEAAKEEI